MNKLAHFQRYQLRYEVVALVSYFLINASLLASSVIMEASRNNQALPFDWWEPFSWEYTSAISTLLLFPMIAKFIDRFPIQWRKFHLTITIYWLGSILFSLAHVGLMVGFRKLIYLSQERYYDFGNVWYELVYEYRKDLWAFLFFVVAIHVYRFVLARLQGEANPIQEGEDNQVDNEQQRKEIDRLLVKKLGKEFIIKVSDVEWLESSGNYVNLYIGERIYPLRITLTKLIEQLADKGFSRIHRSYAVRLDAIESITPISSGDSEIRLKTGKQLTLSRRYKEAFKLQL
ncbi:LytR/AlgR family response regulator transcription factor [Thalassotalea euphylliae]|uniref:LytTR family transcriptional regulator n=1 Tax=Thalassotalea euphylliae TaxID=1655234 RepID=A0A3E0U2B1_9GAMM|nr:LytTR family DNA-binding domain-containing protein [Thalassotalea euphylliae]REL30854.1 LytTR family transcriptional regulator [Thalassotalea euphylliae]